MKIAVTEFITTRPVDEIRGILANVLPAASISQMTRSPLDEDYAIAILAEQRWKPFYRGNFGAGLAGVQVQVLDHGDTRRITLTALGSTPGEALIAGAARDAESVLTFKSSKSMAQALAEALQP